MKLMTQAIAAKLKNAPIGSTDGKPLSDRKIFCKFFTPDSDWTWYTLEGQKNPNSDDWFMFGLVDGIELELGVFNLQQLEEIRGPMGLPIERDKSFDSGEILLKDVPEYHKYARMYP